MIPGDLVYTGRYSRPGKPRPTATVVHVGPCGWGGCPYRDECVTVRTLSGTQNYRASELEVC